MSNGRAARRKLARNDGTVIRVNACCRLELTLSPTRLAARHDDDCPALDPTTRRGLAARTQANEAISNVMSAYGKTLLVMIND